MAEQESIKQIVEEQGTATPSEERPSSCPHLGLQEDPQSMYAQATRSHRCYATGQGEPIGLDHQKTFCLGASFEECDRYVESVTKPAGATTDAFSDSWLKQPVLWLAGVIAVILGLGFVYFQPPSQESATTTGAAPAAAAVLATSTPTVTSTPAAEAVTFVQSTATASMTPSPVSPQATDTPGGDASALGRRTAVLVPAPNAVGWVVSDERSNHFGGQNLHAGTFEGERYYGGLQFRLHSIPPGTTIEGASLELVGLSAENVEEEGTWTLQLLDPTVDEDWISITYERLHNATVLASIPPELKASDLTARQSNIFTFAPEQLRLLEQRLETGLVSFRLDGPSNETSNLFTWDTGMGSADRPELRVVYNLPPTPTPAIVVNTPTPANVVTAAAMSAKATYEATAVGTPTPLPVNYITATPRIIIVNTPTPANAATAQAHIAEATALVYLYGTPTPIPTGAWTATPEPPTPLPSATPTPTPLPLLVSPGEVAATGTVVATPTPATLPLQNKIAFRSDRLGENRVFVMEPDGTNVVWLTNEWVYNRALELETYSPGGAQRAYVKSIDKGEGDISYEIWVQNASDGATWYLTGGNRSSYSPTWSPNGKDVAFVSQASGNDEIFVIDTTTKQETRLTSNEWQWDKQPTWSPDGSQIVFWTNRGSSGQRELWIMNADGSNQRPLLADEWNNWDPVWIK